MVSADVESRYKTKDELEREDHIKYRKHQEMTFLRRQAKIDAEGFFMRAVWRGFQPDMSLASIFRSTEMSVLSK